jgi:hypothetical protein
MVLIVSEQVLGLKVIQVSPLGPQLCDDLLCGDRMAGVEIEHVG